MIETILGSTNKEKILIYLAARGEGHSREIAGFFNTDLNPVQKQIEKLELDGIIFSKIVGRTKIYMFKPSISFLKRIKKAFGKGLKILSGC